MEIQKKYIEIKGKKMAVIDEGIGESIIFLHGNPTSSYLWRNIAPNFLNTNRIIVPDFLFFNSSIFDFAISFDEHLGKSSLGLSSSICCVL